MPMLKRKPSQETPAAHDGKKLKQIADPISNVEVVNAGNESQVVSTSPGKENKKRTFKTGLKKLTQQVGRAFKGRSSTNKDVQNVDAPEPASEVKSQVAETSPEDQVANEEDQSTLPEAEPKLTHAEVQALGRAKRVEKRDALKQADEDAKKRAAEEVKKREAEEVARKEAEEVARREAEELEAILEAAAKTAKEAGAPWTRETNGGGVSLATGIVLEAEVECSVGTSSVAGGACSDDSLSSSAKEPKIYEPVEGLSGGDTERESISKLVPAKWITEAEYAPDDEESDSD